MKWWWLVLLLTVVASACGGKKGAPVATMGTPERFQTTGFVAAPGFFAERDVQYVGDRPHCILRIARADKPDGSASYVEVPMEWCEGVK